MDGIESSDNYIGDTLTNMSTLSDTFQKTDHADQKDPLEQQAGDVVTINVIPQFQYTISAAGAFTQRVNQVNNNDDSVSNILRKSRCRSRVGNGRYWSRGQHLAIPKRWRQQVHQN